MKVIKIDSEIHKKVEEVFDNMSKNGVSFPYLCNSIVEIAGVNARLKIIDAETGQDVVEIPPVCEFRVAIHE